MGLDIMHYIPSPDGLDYLTADDFTGNSVFLERHKHLLKNIEFEGEISQVLYVAEEGYQRKQMNAKFFEDFENDRLYFDLASVIKASKYLQPSPGKTLAELQSEFKKSFVDNFIEGESIFVAGW